MRQILFHTEGGEDFSLAFSACWWRMINSLVLAGSCSNVSMSLPNSFSPRGSREFIGCVLWKFLSWLVFLKWILKRAVTPPR